jgi:hypothetical protein
MPLPTFALILLALVAELPPVEVVRVPGGGVQPQAVADARGAVHLVFLRGNPAKADVFYACREPGQSSFGEAIRVNSEPGSAIAIGTVRGARIALGRGGRVHVAWNGGQGAKPANPVGGSPMLYARSDEARTRFEPQRNVMSSTQALDGGGSVAADGEGNVYVAWHGQLKGETGEANRKMWVARSSDDGATFATETPASATPTGACGCCGIAAMVDSGGSLRLLYRAATQGVERGMVLLGSKDQAATFEGSPLDAWRVNACPMSTASLADGGASVLVAWENRGEVSFARLDPSTGKPGPAISPQGRGGSRKHPSVAANMRGEVLLAWTEDTGWQKGGSLVWQRFDATGNPIGVAERVEGGVPVWGLATVVARSDGGFTIIR